MNELKKFVAYLKKNKLILTTAESCTAGKIISLLANIEGSGKCLDAGYVVYSADAKKRLLGVKQHTIDKYTLTSEAVAQEMAFGALKDSIASVVIATTGITGKKAMDGIPPGTICFAWGFKSRKNFFVYKETRKFSGTRNAIQEAAATHALLRMPEFHEKFLTENK